jgi:CRISPR-associated protein (TIGR03986 family)
MKGEFVNPYNFVPLGNMKEKLDRDKIYGSRACQDNDKELLSGYLDVSMYVKTPLIVPDAAHKPEDEVFDTNGEKVKRAKYDFFNVTNVTEENGEKKTEKKYIIPGSTLRGSIRSMYEAATNSCFPFLMDDDKPSSYRLPLYMHLTKRGLLHYENGNWVLYAAEVNVKESAQATWKEKTDKYGKSIIKNGKVQKKPVFVPPDEMPGTYVEDKGYIQYNEPIDVRKYHIVYLKKKQINDEKGNLVDEKVKTWKDSNNTHTPNKELLSAMMRDGVSGGQGKGTEYQKHIVELLEKAKKDDKVYIPVYYLTVDFNVGSSNNERLVYLSNASIGRIGQHRKWKDIVGAFSPCEDTSRLCPACMLFGTVNGKGMKGHVRFSDALPVREPEIKSYTLDILGKPRHSAYEFYLEKPDGADYWNYDFCGEVYNEKKTYTDKNNKVKVKYIAKLRYKYYTPTIRGRKMYWHSENINTTREPGKTNATMEGVNEGSEFAFKIYFDEITQKQLDDLIWVISLGENDKDSKLQYKIGHGKPLGFGSVKLVVKSQTIREIGNDLNVNTSVTAIENSKASKLSDDSDIYLETETVRSLLEMANAERTRGLKVSYPIALDRFGREDTRVLEWFGRNHENGKKVTVLPKPVKSKITMSAKCPNRPSSDNKCKGCKS